ncbi:MAG: HlyC/CorC family transporter [candidate division Zixibacteria bacterium]|nr:HlyC/CorC family transporter [candidate division Zixibacteria bacterium]
MNSGYFEIIAIVALILANGFFAASEFALIASRKSRLKNWAAKGNKRAERTRQLLKKPERFLATIQVGITFVATLAGVFSGATFVKYIDPVIKSIPSDIIQSNAHSISIVIIVIIVSFLSVIVGELIPKYIAMSAPEKIALWITRPISIFSKMTFFLVSFMTFSARTVLRIFGIAKTQEASTVTEEEINILISEGTENGVFDQTEQKLIKSVFDFSDYSVRQSMTPRVDFISIQIDWPVDKIMEIMTSNGYSRYPVYRESLDQIIGVVYTKDLISLLAHHDVMILKDIIRKPFFVPDSMPLTVLLRKFQKQKVHLAIVLDEFGGTAGLITLEDVLEEIVGEIQDEYDTEQPEFVAHSDTIAFVAAALRPDELNDEFGTNLPEDVSETVAGYIVEKLGYQPKMSEEYTEGKLQFKIIEMDGNRIKRIQVKKLEI